MAKLTNPQFQLLAELPRGVSMDYKPAQKLVELGLASAKAGRYGSTTLVITEYGQAALDSNGKLS